MQIFAISCLLAVLALNNGASVAPKSEQQPRAEVEAQVAETAGQTRAVQVVATEQVASDGAVAELKSTGTEAVSRKQRSLRRLRKGCNHGHHGACFGSSCGVVPSVGCAGVGCGGVPSVGCLGAGCNQGCGGATPCQSNTVVVQQDVPVAQPVPVHVPVVQVVHQNVPVPQPVAVPVVKVVRVPVPVVVSPPRPCCSQPQPCCGQAPLPCSPCSG